MQHRQHNRQYGVALITALLIVALATAAVVGVVTRQEVAIRRTANMLDAERAYFVALGAEEWSRQLLVRDARETKIDTEGEDWAAVLEPVGIEGGWVSSRLEDLQGRFNLNNLVDDEGKPSKTDLEVFGRLLDALGLDRELVQAVADWIDLDINPQPPSGAEDLDYLTRKPPYRTPNQRMASVTELLLVKGVSKDVYDRLEPYVSTLPERTEINVNTASGPVLMAAVKNLSAKGADDLIQERGESGFPGVAEFRGQQALKGLEVVSVGVSSRFFRAEITAGVGRGQVRLYSVLQRAAGEDVTVDVIRRGQGVI